VLALFVGTTALGLYLARAGRPVPAHRERVVSPPARGVYVTGGVPARDAAMHELLAGDFMEFVLAVDRIRGTGRVQPHRAELRTLLDRAEPMAAHGPALAAAWHAMLAALDHWVVVPEDRRTFDKEAHELSAKVRAVSDQLAAAGIGYFLEGDVVTMSGHAHALVFAYRVEDVRFVHVLGLPRRVLSLRRIDRVNLMHNELGMQSDDLGDPVVLLDQIDAHVVRRTLPVLAPEAPYALAEDDDAWAVRDDARALMAAAGAAIRDDLVRALGADAGPATEVATLLEQRAMLLGEHRWRAVDLLLPGDVLDRLPLGDDLPRVQEIELALVDHDAVDLAARCRDVVAASVRRHEAQHGIDADRADALRYPEPLAELLGPAYGDDGEPYRRVERARAELAAYLSQIANDPVTPRLALWNVVRHALTARMAGSAESYAGVLIATGLARELAIPSPGPVIHDREIDRVRLSRIARPLAAVSGDRLRAAARALWRDWYGEPLIPIVD